MWGVFPVFVVDVGSWLYFCIDFLFTDTLHPGTQAVKEAHVLDVERLQSEITNMRTESNDQADEMGRFNKELANKDVKLL